MFEELHPEQQDIQQPNEAMTPRQVRLLLKTTMTVTTEEKRND